MSDQCKHTPLPDEITRECAKIRESWTREDEARRAGRECWRWEPPVVEVSAEAAAALNASN